MKEQVAALPAQSRRLWMVLVLGSLTALAPLSIDMYLPALPTLADDMHTTTSLAQLSLTFCLIGLAVGQLLAGPLSDARGRRMPLIVGILIYILSSLLCAVVPSIWMLIVLRFIQGASGAAGIVIARAIVRDLYAGTEMTKFFALLMLVNGVAPILAPVTGGQLLRVTSWHGVFIVLALLGVLMLIGVITSLPETLPLEKRSTGGIKKTLATMRNLLSDRVFMGYAWSQGLVTAAMFGYISGSPFVLQDLFGVSPQLFSVLFAINGIGIIIAGQVTARLAVRYGETRVFLGGLVYASIGGLGLLTMILTGAGLVAVMIPLFLVVSAVGIVGPTSTSLAMQNQGRNAGSAAALIGVPQLIAGAIAAPLVGLGGSHTATPMGMTIAIADVGAIVLYALLVRGRKSNV
ncbi:multidrug effflux MFS transporter [Tumebacillus permanentifrigoris]|uniref:Bcr/CflA family efflux transporter n=1 Tax=Tumebacillus permanentifrigoris TaxID=378543 RepID=A0A316D763_9BACL|nr:multidrug effflux MFS transporter [Tumebacillus permanentifrigoris]PWK11560.1 DHA1 family bicyclomycin/chloramphenicol resistance-like MFS transporter [Tumebacillus permanentifrigoris]